MNYGDSAHITKLKRDYPNIFDKSLKLQIRWALLRKKLLKLDSSFSSILPIQVNDLLVMEFEGLADIYDKFIALNLRNTDHLIDDAKALFAYENYTDRNKNHWCEMRTEIVAFFLDPKNGFNIHTCHYCDMAYINAYTLGKQNKTQFDLDHVLDKGRCPILGLSLFNLVPSCPICNGPRIKGKKLLYKDPRIRKKLSPTSFLYDFEGIVTIEVHNILGNCSTVGFEERMEEYELRFNTSLDPDYEEVVNAFHLKERYGYHKCEALRLLDLKERYTNARIVEIARLILGIDSNSTQLEREPYITQLKRDIFSIEFNSRFHRCFGKLQEDMLE